MTDRIGQLPFSSFRFLFCCLAVFSGVVPLWASDGPDDDMKETEEEGYRHRGEHHLASNRQIQGKY